MNTYDTPVEILIFGDYMACEIFDAVTRSDGVAYMCRANDYLGSIVAKMACEIGQKRPEKMIVFAGNQDAILGMQPEEYSTHVAMAVEITQCIGVPLTMVVPMPSGDPDIENKLAAYRRELYVFERQGKLELLDLYGIMREQYWDDEEGKLTKRQFIEEYYADSNHLNKDGKETMCSKIYEYFWGF